MPACAGMTVWWAVGVPKLNVIPTKVGIHASFQEHNVKGLHSPDGVACAGTAYKGTDMMALRPPIELSPSVMSPP